MEQSTDRPTRESARKGRSSKQQVSRDGGSALYLALRAQVEQGGGKVDEAALLSVDYTEAQKKYMQLRQEEELMDRLSQRIGTTHNLLDHRSSNPNASWPSSPLHHLAAALHDAVAPHSPKAPSPAASPAQNKLREHGAHTRPLPVLQATPGRQQAVPAVSVDGPHSIPVASTRPQSAVIDQHTTSAHAPNSPGIGTMISDAGVIISPRPGSAAVPGNYHAVASPKLGLGAEGAMNADSPGHGLDHKAASVVVQRKSRSGSGAALQKEDSILKRAASQTEAAMSRPNTAGQKPSGPGSGSTKTPAEKTVARNTSNIDDLDLDAYGDLSQYHPVRQWCITLCTHPDFELLVMIAILVNCVTLSLYQPLEPEDSDWNRKLFWSDLGLNVFYTLEVVLRVGCLGPPWFWSYLRRPWNLFDLFMVIIGYTQFIPSDGSGNTNAIRALRAMRALRPLRTITRFEALRAVVVCFMEAVPLLTAVAGIVAMFLFLYAVAAVQMFTSVFHNICMGPDPVTGLMVREAELRPVDDPDMFGCSGGTDPDPRRFWNSLRTCPAQYNTTCMTVPDSTAVNTAGFDNVGYSMLTEFQCITLTSWGYIMYRSMAATSPFASLYFVSLVVLGAYCVINLFLAVLKTKFAKAQTVFHVKNAKLNKSKRQNTLALLWSKAKSKASELSSRASQNSMMASIIASKQPSRASMRSQGSLISNGDTDPAATHLFSHKALRGDAVKAFKVASHTTAVAPRSSAVTPHSPGVTSHSLAVGGKAAAAGPVGEGAEPKLRKRVTVGGVKFVVPDGLQDSEQQAEDMTPIMAIYPDVVEANKVQLISTGSGALVVAKAVPPARDRSTAWVESDGKEQLADSKAVAVGQPHVAGNSCSGAELQKEPMGMAQDSEEPQQPITAAEQYAATLMSVEEFDEFVADVPNVWKRNLLRAQFRVRKLVEKPWFDNLFLFVIIVNTTLLALEYDGMSDQLVTALWDANMALTIIFSMELVLKLFGLGVIDYVRDGFNVFDAIIVLVSILEIVMVQVSGMSALRSMRALRILRALRVLRLLKVFKYVKSLQKIAEVMFTSFASFFAIVILLALFWLVFTILGMHVFGGTPLPVPDQYPNYDTFLNAMVSTFNVLNLENWNQQMYAVVSTTNMGSTLFFLFWIIIGKYTLLSLFLAVMLEAFEAKYDAQPGGGLGSKVSGILSSLRSKMSSIASSVASSVRSGRSASSGSPSPRASPQRAASATARKQAGIASREPSTAQRQQSKVRLQEQAQVLGDTEKDVMARDGQLTAAAAGHGQGLLTHDVSAMNAISSNLTAHEGIKTGQPVAEGIEDEAPRKAPVDGRGIRGDAARGSGGVVAGSVQGRQASAYLAPVSAPVTGLMQPQRLQSNSGIASLLPIPDPLASAPVSNQVALSGTAMPAGRQTAGRSTVSPGAVRSIIIGQETPEPLPTLAEETYGSGTGEVAAQQAQLPDPTAAPAYSPEPLVLLSDLEMLSPPPLSPFMAHVVSHRAAAINHSDKQEGVAGSTVNTARERASEAPVVSRQSGQCSLEQLSATQHSTGTHSVLGKRVSVDLQRWLDEMPDQLMAPPPEPVLVFAELGNMLGGDEDGDEDGDETALITAGQAAPIRKGSRASSSLPAAHSTASAQSGVVLPDQPNPVPLTNAILKRHSVELGILEEEQLFDQASSVAGEKHMKAPSLHAVPLNAGTLQVLTAIQAEKTPTVRFPSITLLNFAPMPEAPTDNSPPALPTQPLASQPLSSEALSGVDSETFFANKTQPSQDSRHQLPQGLPTVHLQNPAGDGFSKQVTLGSQVTVTRLNSGVSDASSHRTSAGGSYDGERQGEEGHKHKLSPEEQYRRRQARRNGAIMIEGSGKSFWYFDEDHPVRVWVYDRITTKWYDYAMFLIIGFNCTLMAIENPSIEDGSSLGLLLYWSDVAFLVVFGLEVIIKSFAFTFRLYVKETTNQVDLVIVVVSVLVLSLEAVTSNAQVLTALRVLRAIKPLRMLTRSAGMRMVFKSVMLSMAAMVNVSLVCIMFFLIFAILGTQLFMGLFWSCNDNSVANKDQCVGLYVDPITNNTLDREWSNAFPNFDNVGNSLLVCFITATLNGYTATMIQAMSAPQTKDDQPKMNQNPGAFFWFAGFTFVCAFTLINLYVGVIFSQFSRIRLISTTGSAFLTSSQQEWAELSKMIFKLKPAEKAQAPRNPIRKLCYWLSSHTQFEFFMMAIVIANMVCLAMKHWGMSDTMARQLDMANYFFVAVFVTEAVVKVTALGWAKYWKDGWNRFDLVLAALALLDVLVSAVQASFLRALRVLRMQRLLRLLRAVQMQRVARMAADIRALFETLLAAVPAFGNVGSLLGLIFFMYSYVGVYMFGTLRWNVGINEDVNFTNFLQATLLLMRVATGDNWSNILMDCMPQKDCDPNIDSCGTYVALPYFLSFVLVVSVILLNLFVAVIVETFEKTHEQEDWKLTPQALEEFVTLWSEYDDGSGSIQPRHLEELLLKLEPPLGLGSMADNKDVLRFVYDLDIPLVGGRVPFHKTIFELVKRVSQSAIPEGALKEQLDRLVEKFFRSLQGQDVLNFRAAVSVGRVQRSWRARTRAAKLKRKKAWRASRTSTPPSYMAVCDERAYLLAHYQSVKEAERWAFNSKNLGTYTPRWKFNPAYTRFADELEKPISTAKKLKNLMHFAFRGIVKVAPYGGLGLDSSGDFSDTDMRQTGFSQRVTASTHRVTAGTQRATAGTRVTAGTQRVTAGSYRVTAGTQRVTAGSQALQRSRSSRQ